MKIRKKPLELLLAGALAVSSVSPSYSQKADEVQSVNPIGQVAEQMNEEQKYRDADHELYATQALEMYNLLSDRQKELIAYDFTKADQCDKVKFYDGVFNEWAESDPATAISIWIRTNMDTPEETLNSGKFTGLYSNMDRNLPKKCSDFNTGYELNEQ